MIGTGCGLRLSACRGEGSCGPQSATGRQGNLFPHAVLAQAAQGQQLLMAPVREQPSLSVVRGARDHLVLGSKDNCQWDLHQGSGCATDSKISSRRSPRLRVKASGSNQDRL